MSVLFIFYLIISFLKWNYDQISIQGTVFDEINSQPLLSVAV